MDPSGPSRKTSRDNGHHKRLVKQVSEPLATAENGRRLVVGVKDIYSSKSSGQKSSKGHEQQALGKANNSSRLLAQAGGNSEAEAILGQPSVRRLSQSGVASGSEEYQCVLKDFISPPVPKVEKPKVVKTKCRKISFNEFGKASRTSRRLEDMSLSPRPRRSFDTFNAPTISSINRAVDHRETNGRPNQSRSSLPFSNIKEAWQESSLQSSQVERRRHVSLPAPPVGFALENRIEEQTIVESFAAEKTTRKVSNNNSLGRPNRKISTVISPNLHNMSSTANNATTTNVREVFPGSNSVCAEENKDSGKTAPRTKKISPSYSREVTKIKVSTANVYDIHPNLLLGVKNKQTGNNGELPTAAGGSVDSTAERDQPSMRARKNFQRIGKAAVATRRFLGMQNRDSGTTKNSRGISPLARDEKPFEEMVEDMKYSYQDLKLGKSEEGKSACQSTSAATEVSDLKSRYEIDGR